MTDPRKPVTLEGIMVAACVVALGVAALVTGFVCWAAQH